MRTTLTILAALVLAGCVAPDAPETVENAAADVAEIPEAVVQEFHGHMTASALGGLAHVNPEVEMAVAPIQREGFLLEVVSLPTAIQIDLTWTAAVPGSNMLAMVNIPTSTSGKVIDVFSESTDSGAVCMRLPVGEIQPGLVSVMAHSSNAVELDYTMTITSIGGEVVLHEDRGHMEVERADAEERDALPCETA